MKPRTTTDLQSLENILKRYDRAKTELPLHPAEKPSGAQKLFSTWEVSRYLLPIGQAHFLRTLKANPNLPQGNITIDGGSKWFTIEDIIKLREFFEKKGSKKKGYNPPRPKDMKTRIVCLANTTQQSGKTTTATHLAIASALDGYKVLIIDMNPHNDLTKYFQKINDKESGTLYQLFEKLYADKIVNENHDRIRRDETPLILSDSLSSARKIKLQQVIKETCWPSISIIRSSDGLHIIEAEIADWKNKLRGWKNWRALQEILSADESINEYDFIFLDTPSSFGFLTITALYAANVVIIPMNATYEQVSSTESFLKMFFKYFKILEEKENITSRALGEENINFKWSEFYPVITKYQLDEHRQMLSVLRNSLGSLLPDAIQNYTPIIDTNTPVYAVDYRHYNREIYAKSRESFDETYAYFKSRILRN